MKNNPIGNIFDIQHFSIGDGPGIRTTVFLKGCPLKCQWCHNPESHRSKKQIIYQENKCVNCGMCVAECLNGCHSLCGGKHGFCSYDCNVCGKCIKVCPRKCLEFTGTSVTVDEVLAEITEDMAFYSNSGGITLSGGEPLMQYDFSYEVLKEAKKLGMHTAIETSGYCNKSLEEINRYVDIWLYDIKMFSEDEHIKYTGVSNKKIFENISYLDEAGANIILRCPIIPGINFTEKHFEEIAKLENEMKNILAVHIELYNPLGIDKALKLGKEPEYKNKKFLSVHEVEPFVDKIRKEVKVSIKIL